MTVEQMCAECGSPLRPCRCERPKKSKAWNSTLPQGSFADARTDERYGPAWERVKKLPCVLYTLNFYGVGHQCCGYGEMTGHTAHHLSRLDRDGIIPCCGKAHDLLHNRGSKRTQATFRTWTEANAVDWQAVGLRYYEEAI